MEIPDNGIDLAEFARDLVLSMGGFFLTIMGVVLVLGWVAYAMKAGDQ